jgi:hypothetical protein
MNDTPETDELIKNSTHIKFLEEDHRSLNSKFTYTHPIVLFCRKLERELTAARKELAEWSILNGWGGTPEIITDFIKGQQTRIHYAQNLDEELTAVTEQRDRLAEALERVLEYQGRFAEEDPESIAAEALAAVEGGSDDRPILRHNGVGIADMYQPGELEKELRSMTGAEPQNA